MAAPKTISRFKGSMVGGVVGDCIGAVFEGLWGSVIPLESVLSEVEQISTVAQKLKGSPRELENVSKKMRQVWQYTDDTAMARSVAKTLIANNSLVVKDIAKRFTEEYFKQMWRGYGSGVVSVFRQLAESNYEDVFGPSQRQFEGEGSYGNGGAMRIAPAALFAHRKQLDFDQLQELVQNITLVTHSHNGAILGSVLQCYAVYLALHTDKLDIDTFLDQIQEKLAPLEKKMMEEKMKTKERPRGDMEASSTEKGKDIEAVGDTYAAKLEKIRQFAKQEKQPTDREVDEQLGTDISALGSAPTALYCFLRATKPIEGIDESYNAFERTIIYAISLGGDTDTIATMAGAIAGAYYGLESVPWSWQKCCEGVQDALKDAESLCDLTQSSS